MYDGSATANFTNTSLKLKDFVSALNAGAQYIEMDSTNKRDVISQLQGIGYIV